MIKPYDRRLRRAKKIRAKLKALDMPRLSVHISSKHIYVQIIHPNGNVLACSSTLDKNVRSLLEKKSVNVQSAALVGKSVAEKALTAGIKKVGFDRSGYKYHGRVKALADAAREAGLNF